MKQIRRVLFLVFLSVSLLSFGQNSGFELHAKSANTAENRAVQAARYKYVWGAITDGGKNSYGNLDPYRLYDQRRNIDIANSDFYVEVYSEKELNEKFNKPILNGTAHSDTTSLPKIVLEVAESTGNGNVYIRVK